MPEFDAIKEYMLEGKTKKLEDIIVINDNISLDMKFIIADLVSGKLKRSARKKPSKFERDKILHRFVAEHLDKGHKLTSSSTVDGAITLVAEGTNETEDVVCNAYKRIKKHNKKTLLELGKEDSDI